MGKELYRYRFSAEVIRLSLRKSIGFSTRVVWKRNTSRTETQLVPHLNYESRYCQNLAMELSLVYNSALLTYESKTTEFAVLVHYQGRVKSGGYAKIDMADIIRSPPSNQSHILHLTECPDSEAFLEVVFNYALHDLTPRTLQNQLQMLENQPLEDYSASESEEDKIPTPQIIAAKPLKLQRKASKIERIMTNLQSLGSKIKRRLSFTPNPQDDLPYESKLRKSSNTIKTDPNLSKISRQGLAEELSVKNERVKELQQQLQEQRVEIVSVRSNAAVLQNAYDKLAEWANRNTLITQQLLQKQEHYQGLCGKVMEEIEKEPANMVEVKNTAANAMEEMQVMCSMPTLSRKVIPRQSVESATVLGLSSASNLQSRDSLTLYSGKLVSKGKIQSNSKIAQDNIIPDDKMLKIPFSKKKRWTTVQEVPNCSTVAKHIQERIDLMEEENNQLRNRLAMSSLQLAQMLNAAAEKGGSPLLSFFYRSIGLVDND